MYKYAIIGFGGLGKLHLSNLISLQKERKDFTLAAICGTTAEEAKKSVRINIGEADLSNFDFSSCVFYDDYKKMIEAEELDFVLSVLPSFMHEEVAVYCMEHGIHVFSEKPMALTQQGCERMIETSKRTGKKLVIGQCLRFDFAFRTIKSYIESGCYGKVCRAEFLRHSQMPLWTWNNWVLDPMQSGGCIVDMHVHDVDLIQWFFGLPNSLQSRTTSHKVEKESVFTQYFYDDFFVCAQADWSLPQKFPFTMRCMVNFEKAVVVVENDTFKVYLDDEIIVPKNISKMDYFYEEMKAFLELIIDDIECSALDSQSVYNSMKVVMAEVDSAEEEKIMYFEKY